MLLAETCPAVRSRAQPHVSGTFDVAQACEVALICCYAAICVAKLAPNINPTST